MGCGGSKDTGASETGKSKAPPSADDEEEVPGRGSVYYQSRELQSGRGSSSQSVRKSAVFDTMSIGTCTRHGIAPLPGGRGAKAKINQDRGVVCWPFNHKTSEALLCIFDGHGRSGEMVSEYCMNTIPKVLEEDPKSMYADTAAYMAKQIVKADTILMNDSPIKDIARMAGTTSTVCYMRGNTCWVACSGDSRAVLGSRAGGKIVSKDLSKDHKPDDPPEQARIESKGGVVTPGGYNGNPPPSRVWAGNKGGVGLAMSRSIGDHELRQWGVIPDPEITRTEVKPANGKGDGDLFLIVASDGVWEFIESKEACEIIHAQGADATKACQVLVREAQQRWKDMEGTYRDDITCVVAMLPFLDEAPEGPNEEEEEDGVVTLNTGEAGLGAYSADAAAKDEKEELRTSAGKTPAEDHDDFVARRLSVAHLDFGDDDDEK